MHSYWQNIFLYSGNIFSNLTLDIVIKLSFSFPFLLLLIFLFFRLANFIFTPSVTKHVQQHQNQNLLIIIGIQPLGRFGQRPDLSQATGMVLVRCILGKFLGVACHCFPPLLDVPTFATRCLHVRHDTRDPSG